MEDISKNLTVLLVDPSSEEADRINGYLQRIDEYDVSFDHLLNREAVLNFLEHNRPDLIFLEHAMNDGSGLSLAREIRLDHDETPIIVVTDEGNEQICAKYFQIGVDGYRVKAQLDPDVLQTSVESAFTHRENKVELKHAAKFDELTKLYNRRFAFKRIHEEMTAAVRHDHPFSVCLIDLDGFKAINDRLGHQAGDFLLKRVSELIKESIRADDIAGRYGGDEFLLALRNTGSTGAFKAAKKLSQKIDESEFNLPAGEKTRISCSIGVAEFNGEKYTHDDDIETAEEFIDRADKALYHAKKKEPGSVERRRHERFRVEDPVPVTLQFDNDRTSAQLVNFSKNGVRLKDSPPVKVGQNVTLLFHSGTGQRLEKQGIIRSCQEDEDASTASIGVEVEIPRQLMHILENLINKTLT